MVPSEHVVDQTLKTKYIAKTHGGKKKELALEERNHVTLVEYNEHTSVITCNKEYSLCKSILYVGQVTTQT